VLVLVPALHNSLLLAASLLSREAPSRLLLRSSGQTPRSLQSSAEDIHATAAVEWEDPLSLLLADFGSLSRALSLFQKWRPSAKICAPTHSKSCWPN